MRKKEEEEAEEEVAEEEEVEEEEVEEVEAEEEVAEEEVEEVEEEAVAEEEVVEVEEEEEAVAEEEVEEEEAAEEEVEEEEAAEEEVAEDEEVEEAPTNNDKPDVAYSTDSDLDDDGLIEIGTFAEFNNIRNSLAGTSYKTTPSGIGVAGCPVGCTGYELTADIEIPSSHTWETITNVGGTAPFTGIFDGNGYRITGLSGTDGLFHEVGGGAVVKNFSAEIDITSTETAYLYGIAHNNRGTIENVSVNGVINSATGLGGIAVNNYGTIQNSLVIITATGLSDNPIGGIASNNQNGAVIKNVYVGGKLIGGNRGLGAIVSSNVAGASIINSYVVAEFETPSGGSLRNIELSYTGSGTVTDSYLDREIANLRGRSGDRKKSKELKDPRKGKKGIYNDWDSNVWDFGGRSDYPVLEIPVSYGECSIIVGTPTCKQPQPYPVPPFNFAEPISDTDTIGIRFGAKIIFIKAPGRGYDVRAQRGRRQEQKRNIIDFSSNKKIATAEPILHIDTQNGGEVPTGVSAKLIDGVVCDADTFGASLNILGGSVTVTDNDVTTVTNNGVRSEGYISLGRSLGKEDNDKYVCVKLEKTAVETEYIISQRITRLRNKIGIEKLSPRIESISIFSDDNPDSFEDDVDNGKVPKFRINYYTERADSSENVDDDSVIRFFENTGSTYSCPFVSTPIKITEATRTNVDSPFSATMEIKRNFLLDEATSKLDPTRVGTIGDYSCFVTLSNEFGRSVASTVDFSVGEATAPLAVTAGELQILPESITVLRTSAGDPTGRISLAFTLSSALQEDYETRSGDFAANIYRVSHNQVSPEHRAPSSPCPATVSPEGDLPWQHLGGLFISYPEYVQSSALVITTSESAPSFIDNEKYCLGIVSLRNQIGNRFLDTDVSTFHYYPSSTPYRAIPVFEGVSNIRIGSIDAEPLNPSLTNFEYFYLGDELFLDLEFNNRVLLGNSGVTINGKTATLITSSFQSTHTVHIQIDEETERTSSLAVVVNDYISDSGAFHTPRVPNSEQIHFIIIDPARPNLPNDLIIQPPFTRTANTINEYNFKFTLSNTVRSVFSNAVSSLLADSYVVKKTGDTCPAFLMELEGFPGWEKNHSSSFEYNYDADIEEYPMKITLAEGDQFDPGSVYCVGVYGGLQDGAVMLIQSIEFIAGNDSGDSIKPRVIGVEDYKIKKVGATSFTPSIPQDALKHNDEIQITIVFSEKVLKNADEQAVNITSPSNFLHFGYAGEITDISGTRYATKHIYTARVLNPELGSIPTNGELHLVEKPIAGHILFAIKPGFTTADNRTNNPDTRLLSHWSVDHTAPILYSPLLQDVVVETDGGVETRKLFTFISTEQISIRDTELGSCYSSDKAGFNIIEDVGPNAIFGNNAIFIPPSRQSCLVNLTDLAGNVNPINLFNFVDTISVDASNLTTAVASRAFTFGLGDSIKDYITNTQKAFNISTFYRVKTTPTCPRLFRLAPPEGVSGPELGGGWSKSTASNSFTYDASADLSNIAASFTENSTLPLQSGVNYCLGIAFNSAGLNSIPTVVTDFTYSPTTSDSTPVFVFRHSDGTSVNFAESGPAVQANVVFNTIPTNSTFNVRAVKIDITNQCTVAAFSGVPAESIVSVSDFSKGVEKEIFTPLTEVDNGKKICLEVIKTTTVLDSPVSESPTYSTSQNINNIITSDVTLTDSAISFSKNNGPQTQSGRATIGDNLSFTLRFSSLVTQPIVLVNGTPASIESNKAVPNIYAKNFNAMVDIQRTTYSGPISLSVITTDQAGRSISIEKETFWSIIGTNPKFTELRVLDRSKDVVRAGGVLVPNTQYITEITFDEYVSKPTVIVGGMEISSANVVGGVGTGNGASIELFTKYEATFTVKESDSTANPIVIGTNQGLLEVSVFDFIDANGVSGVRTVKLAENIFVDYETPQIIGFEAIFDGPSKQLADGDEFVEHRYAKAGTSITLKIYVKELSTDLTRAPYNSFTAELSKNNNTTLLSVNVTNPTVADNGVYIFETIYTVPANSPANDIGVDDLLFITTTNLRDNVPRNTASFEISLPVEDVIIDTVKPLITNGTLSIVRSGIKPILTFNASVDVATINFSEEDACSIDGNKSYTIVGAMPIDIELDLIDPSLGETSCSLVAADFVGNASTTRSVTITNASTSLDLNIDESTLYPIDSNSYEIDFALSNQIDSEIRNLGNTLSITPIIAERSGNSCIAGFAGVEGATFNIDSTILSPLSRQSDGSANYTLGLNSIDGFVEGTEYCVRLDASFANESTVFLSIFSNIVGFNHQSVSIGTITFPDIDSYGFTLLFSQKLKNALLLGHRPDEVEIFESFVEVYYKEKKEGVSVCEISSQDLIGDQWKKATIPLSSYDSFSQVVSFPIARAVVGTTYCLAVTSVFDDDIGEVEIDPEILSFLYRTYTAFSEFVIPEPSFSYNIEDIHNDLFIVGSSPSIEPTTLAVDIDSYALVGSNEPAGTILSTSDGVLTFNFTAANSNPTSFSVNGHYGDEIITTQISVPAISPKPTSGNIGLLINKDSNILLEGESVIYTVALTSEPTGNVVIAIDLPVGFDLSTSASSLTFAQNLWHVPQPVTITSGDNTSTNGTPITISHTSTTADYSGITLPSVQFEFFDNDNNKLLVSKDGADIDNTTITIAEGATHTHKVSLSSKPTGNVEITPSFDSNLLQVSPSTITITPTNWNTGVDVTVTSTDDEIYYNNSPFPITYTLLGGDYSTSATIPNVRFIVTDNDNLGYTHTVPVATPQNRISEGAESPTYTLVLNSKPTGNVRLNLSPVSTALLGADVVSVPSSLLFTPTNWNTAQDFVIVAGYNDQLALGAFETGTLNIAVTGANYDSYVGDSPAFSIAGSDDLESADTTPIGIVLSTSILRVLENTSNTSISITAEVYGGVFSQDTTVSISVRKENRDSNAVDFAPVPSFEIEILANRQTGVGSFTLNPEDDLFEEITQILSVDGAVAGQTANFVSSTLVELVDDGDTLPIEPPNNQPAFPSNTLGASALENASAGVSVTDNLIAVDLDGDTLFYSKEVGGDGNHNFDVNFHTGVVTTSSSSVLNYEIKNEYTLIVGVSDRKDINGLPDFVVDDTITVNISIIDVSLEPPQTPINLTVSALSDSKLSVGWQNGNGGSSSVVTYAVRHKVSGTNTFIGTNIEFGPSGTTVTISNLTPDTAYDVKVTASNNIIESAPTDIVTGTTLSPITPSTLDTNLFINAVENTGNIPLSGSNEDGVSISLALTDTDGVAITLESADASITGTSWVYVLPTNLLTKEGTYIITMTTSKALFNDIELVSNLVLDTIAPAKPTLDLSSVDDTGVADDDDKTKTTSGITIIVSGEVGASVALQNNNTPIDGATGTISAGGEVQIDISLVEGTHPISAIVTDLSGNATTSDPFSIIVDTTPPTAPAYTPPSLLTVGVSASIPETSSESNVIYTASNLPSGLSIDATTGDITGVPSATVTSITNINITATDDVGNEAVTPLALPVVSAGTILTATTLDINPFINPQGGVQLTLTGDNENGVSIFIALTDTDSNAVTLTNATATVLGSSWVYTFPTGTFVIEGTYKITLTTSRPFYTDIILTRDILIDRTAPEKPTLDLFSADDTGVADDDNKTKNTAGLTIIVSGETGTTVALQNNDTPIAGATGTISAGTVSIDISLSEGEHPITAVSTDLSGNATTSDPLSIIVDTTSPVQPNYTPPASLAVGVSTNIPETSTESTVTYTASNLPSGLIINPTTGDITGAPLSSSITSTETIITVTDIVDNKISATLTLPPIVEGDIETLTTLDTNLFINAIENTGNIVLSGSNEDGVSITLALTNTSNVPIVLESVDANVTGTSWGYVFPSSLLTIDGTYGITITTHKTLFNDSILVRNLVVDTTLPEKPTLDLSSADDTGVADDDNKTKITTLLTIIVSGEAGTSVVLYNNNTPITGATGTILTSGEISIDISLPEGGHSITAIAIDTAGNTISSNPLLQSLLTLLPPPPLPIHHLYLLSWECRQAYQRHQPK